MHEGSGIGGGALKKYSVALDGSDLRFSHGNESCIGQVLQDVDGYYKFFPDLPSGGYVNPYHLRDIADLVDGMNKEWDDIVQNDPRIGGG